jgi:crotonobetainyl-CoA:carnitine CoA-transferase CaiB-like acyl-CoA transferase
MAGALEGIRVLDLSQLMAGPLASLLLGDMGADVVKVEPPDGDAMRFTAETFINGENSFFLSLNRNKRSVVLDLKHEAGRRAFMRLAETADVVLENLRPGAVARLRVDYESVRRVNPRVVYCSVSGFGQRGPNRNRPAVDPIIQAESGLMSLTGTPESGPLRTGMPIADFVAPVFAALAIVSALFARQASGHGQKIELSMLDASVFSMMPREGYFFIGGENPLRLGNEHYQIVPTNVYPTKDGRLIKIVAHAEKFWRLLVEALGDETLAKDPRFRTNADRLKHREEVDRRLREILGRRTLSEWTVRLGEHGVLFAPVREMSEVLTDPAILTDEMVVELDHPRAGRIKLLGNPMKFLETPVQFRRPPPLLGQHTREVLKEAGYTDDEVDRLRAAGAIRLSDGGDAQSSS